jgi:predicted porin
MKVTTENPMKHRVVLMMAILLSAANINIAHAIGSNTTDCKWEYSLAPLFLWAQGIEGDSQVGPTTTPLDITFKNALDNLEATFTVHYEMKRDALTLFAEYQYVNLNPEAEGPMDTELDIDFKDTIGELGVGYWVFGTDRTNWELIGGARYTKQDLDVSVKNGPDLISTDDDWWVGFFGGRFSAQLSKNWTFIGRADFGVGPGETNRIWNLDAMVDYRFKDWGSVFAGYKYMDYDYENSDKGKSHYAYDATQQGPLLGLNFYW